jgi:hypothetical protein
LGDLTLDEEDDIKMDFEEIWYEDVNWIYEVRAFVDAVMNVRIV